MAFQGQRQGCRGTTGKREVHVSIGPARAVGVGSMCVFHAHDIAFNRKTFPGLQQPFRRHWYLFFSCIRRPFRL